MRLSHGISKHFPARLFGRAARRPPPKGRLLAYLKEDVKIKYLPDAAE